MIDRKEIEMMRMSGIHSLSNHQSLSLSAYIQVFYCAPSHSADEGALLLSVLCYAKLNKEATNLLIS